MEKPKNRKLNKKKNGKIKYCLILILSIVIVLCITYFSYGYVVYSNRFLPGTIVEGIDCGNMISDECVNELTNRIENYVLEIKKSGEIIDSVSSEAVSLTVSDDIEQKVKDAIDSQSKLGWAFMYISKPTEISLENITQIDDESFDNFIKDSVGYNLPTTIENKDQSIEFVEGSFKVGAPVYGDEIDKEAYILKVKNSMLLLEESLELNDADCYTKPDNNEDKDKYEEACKKANELLNYGALNIKIDNFNGDIVKEIAETALVIDENYNVKFDKATIASAVDKISEKYNTYGGTHKFKTSHGTVVDVKGGDYGYILGTKGLTENAVKAFLNGETVDMTLKYTQNVLNPEVEGLGNTYVEVDLTNQYVFVYVDGKLVVESPCVTGLANTSRATPQGIYMLKNKLMDVPLVGDNYVTPVKYWMPFNGGIGLHDAVWQSKFGGEMYKSKGSHGCVNLPMDKAEEIYKNVVVKMPVVCYYHERLSEYQAVPSTGPVMGQYRSLTASEQATLNRIKNGGNPGGNVVIDSAPATEVTESVTEQATDAEGNLIGSNGNVIIQEFVITPAAVE